MEIQEKYKKLSRIALSLKKRVKDGAEQNQTLKEENERLKENISSLYKTAMKEIQRKDRTIAELRAEKDNFAFRRHKRTSNSNKVVQHDSKNKRITDIEKHYRRNDSDISNKNRNDTSLPQDPYTHESSPETSLEPLSTEDIPDPNIDTLSVKPPPNPYNTHTNMPLTLYSQRLLNRVLTSSKNDIRTKIKNESTSSPLSVNSHEPKQIAANPVKQEHSSSMLAGKESFTKVNATRPFVSDSPEAVVSSKQTNVISCETAESVTKSIKIENSGLTATNSSITITTTPRQFISDSSEVVTKWANVDSRASSPIVTKPDNQSSLLSTSAVENSVARKQDPQSFDSDLFSLTQPESNDINECEDTSNCNSIRYSSFPSIQHANKTKLTADDADIERVLALSQLSEPKFEDRATGDNCAITTNKSVLISSATTRRETIENQSLHPVISDIKSEPMTPHTDKVSPSSSSSENFGFKRKGRVKIINVITPSKGEIKNVAEASTEKNAAVFVSKRSIDNINQDNDTPFNKQFKISDAVSSSNKSLSSSGTGEVHDDFRQEKENLFSGISYASAEREDKTTEWYSESKRGNHVSRHNDDKSHIRDDKLSLEPAKITYKRYSDQDVLRRNSNGGFDQFKSSPKLHTKERRPPETDKNSSLKYRHSSSAVKCEDENLSNKEKSYGYDRQSSSRDSRRKYSRSSSSREMSGHSSPRRSGNREKVRIKYYDREGTYRSRSRSSSDNSKKQIHTTHSDSELRNSARAKRTVQDKNLESREVVGDKFIVEGKLGNEFKHLDAQLSTSFGSREKRSAEECVTNDSLCDVKVDTTKCLLSSASRTPNQSVNHVTLVGRRSRPLYLSSALAQAAPTTLPTSCTAPQSMFSKLSVMTPPQYTAPALAIDSREGHCLSRFPAPMGSPCFPHWTRPGSSGRYITRLFLELFSVVTHHWEPPLRKSINKLSLFWKEHFHCHSPSFRNYPLPPTATHVAGTVPLPPTATHIAETLSTPHHRDSRCRECSSASYRDSRCRECSFASHRDSCCRDLIHTSHRDSVLLGLCPLTLQPDRPFRR
uniref:(California timema) hypothetical protein n=1 Tax=Timema californicum TaxID=61474 RepID=A0A7R9J3Z3_TIMCA|nr:unnamed protein product [Timema californicum]